MAKAKATKTETAPQTEGAPQTPETKPAVERGLNDTFKRVLGSDGKGVAPSKKLAPQAMVIVNTIEAAGEAGITRKALIEQLPAAGLVTRQPVGRILSYYQKEIVASGAVTHDKVAA